MVHVYKIHVNIIILMIIILECVCLDTICKYTENNRMIYQLYTHYFTKKDTKVWLKNDQIWIKNLFPMSFLLYVLMTFSQTKYPVDMFWMQQVKRNLGHHLATHTNLFPWHSLLNSTVSIDHTKVFEGKSISVLK